MKGSTIFRFTKWALVLAVAVLGVGLAPAHADTVFTVSGTFSNGSILGGTITINTTLGTVTASTLAITVVSPNSFPFVVAGVLGQGPDSPGYFADFTTVSNGTSSSVPLLSLVFQTATDSLVGYSGGSLCTQSSGCGDPSEYILNGAESPLFIFLNSGTVAPATISTPEPASLLLLGMGLAGVGLLRRKRRMANA